MSNHPELVAMEVKSGCTRLLQDNGSIKFGCKVELLLMAFDSEPTKENSQHTLESMEVRQVPLRPMAVSPV